MKAARGVLWALLIVLTLGGCAKGNTPIPTPLPPHFIPTAVAMTAQALSTPTRQIAPTATAPAPSPTAGQFPKPTATKMNTPLPTVALPTATPTPLPASKTPERGYAPVQILYPGANSRVLSPLKTRFAVIGRYTDELHVELIGEDGRLIYRRVMRLGENQPAHALIFFNLEIPFELQAEAEVGRLQISAWDDKHRPLFQNAVPLILLKEGQQQINYHPAEKSPIIFVKPRPLQTISGGELEVEGKALPSAGVIELLLANPSGKVLLYKTAPLGAPAADGYAPFSITLKYTVKQPLWVRLIARENSKKPEGMIYLNSLELRLAP